MLIVSKHKDYYDGVAQSKGIDKTIVYKRENIIITDLPNELKKLSHVYHHRNKKWELKNIIAPFFIGFCGNFYVGYKIINPDNFKISQITYDYEQIKLKYNLGYWDSNKFNNLENEIKVKKNYELFDKYNTPCFVFDVNLKYQRLPYEIILNPTLKDYLFYKIKDCFTAFQDIEIFISEQLTRNKEIIELNDKQKILKHGFDLKTSFRNL